MTGERLAGKYELRRLLGQGAMGAVYEGVHVDIGKRVAIKLIHPEFCESSEVVARFRREARAASAVESEHIVQIFDFGDDERLGLYMVIEYLEGEDLETRLRRERWISEREAVSIALQVGRGLVKAHAAGIVHRDLKPANIYLVERDDGPALAKVLDFGISKFDPLGGPSSAAEPTLTAHGTTLGTPQYMSPEQCQGRGEVDARTDVWSLAAVLYEMLAGEPAVPDAGGHIATMQRIVREDVAPLATRAPWVGARVAAQVDAALRRRRDARTRDAASFVAGLLDALPDAGSRPVLPLAHPTDVSELGPPSSDTLPPPHVEVVSVIEELAPPSADYEEGPPSTRAVVVTARPATPPAPLAPSAQPPELPAAPRSDPPSSADPPASTGDVAIFVRSGDLPRELAALRARKK